MLALFSPPFFWFHTSFSLFLLLTLHYILAVCTRLAFSLLSDPKHLHPHLIFSVLKTHLQKGKLHAHNLGSYNNPVGKLSTEFRPASTRLLAETYSLTRQGNVEPDWLRSWMRQLNFSSLPNVATHQPLGAHSSLQPNYYCLESHTFLFIIWVKGSFSALK